MFTKTHNSFWVLFSNLFIIRLSCPGAFAIIQRVFLRAVLESCAWRNCRLLKNHLKNWIVRLILLASTYARWWSFDLDEFNLYHVGPCVEIMTCIYWRDYDDRTERFERVFARETSAFIVSVAHWIAESLKTLFFFFLLRVLKISTLPLPTTAC